MGYPATENAASPKRRDNASAMAFAFPFFWLLDTKDPLIITLTIVAAITFGQMIGFAVGAPWYTELFAAPMRYSGASLGFQIGTAISGGLTPFAAATFLSWTNGAAWPISIYLIALAVVALRATIAAALSRCHAKSASGLRLTDFQAAATASRHVVIAASRSTRCDLADVRWRWTLNVL